MEGELFKGRIADEKKAQNITVSQFKKIVEEYGFENELVSDVVSFIKLINSQKSREVSVCGHCHNRKMEGCPFPDQSELTMPPCLSFRQ